MPIPADESGEAPFGSPDTISALEARVLGCLIEKEFTTPEYYPLSLNALINACNQKSNRDPVMSVASREVEVAIENLRLKRLITLFAGADARVPKFKQTIDLVYPMETADRAILCELLIRGPQTSGELRGRVDRMRPFADLAAVEEALARLATRASGPLATKLPRQPGQKEARWTQLLTGMPTGTTTVVDAPSAPLTVEVTIPPAAEARIAALESEVARLRAGLSELRESLGMPPGE